MRQLHASALTATVGLCAACLAGCGGSGSGSRPPAPVPATVATSVVRQPSPVSLYPVGTSAGVNRLFVTVSAVGTQAVSLPLVFDTGSSGITLNALALFPSSIVSANGFNFSQGQTTITYNGVTITNQQGLRPYGGANGTTQVGNLGFTQVTFGDPQGGLTTGVMPVFLYYQVRLTATGQPVVPAPEQGIFGVNSVTNVITIGGSPEPAAGWPPCSVASSGSCRVVSVLKYVGYDGSLNAGFMLAPAPLQACDITSSGSCQPVSMLTVGLTQSAEAGFSTVSLTCPPPSNVYIGPPTMDGYPVCLPAILNSTVTLSVASTGTMMGEVLFDSGTPFMVINVPFNMSIPASISNGTMVQVTMPSGFTFNYVSGTGIDATADNQNQPAVIPSIVGIGFFTTNSLFVDFTSSTEGWK